MKIACLGWGSLIWRPGSLKIQRQWFNDGPFLPIEFSRQSEDGRLTLVINQGSKPVRCLWALMDTVILEDAVASLLEREGIKSKNKEKHLGVLSVAENSEGILLNGIKDWAKNLKLDAVIWTSLEPKFNGEANKTPTLAEALNYLRTLEVRQRHVAEEYIRRAPLQVDTEYRQAFEAEFGWTHIP